MASPPPRTRRRGSASCSSPPPPSSSASRFRSVGTAVTLTLAATLFASWAWGFTLNRVSLFALIFSIGILVDDAIVVVENIHRWHGLEPDKPLWQIIPGAVDEVGGP